MNKHIKSLKKGLLNVCNKLKQNNSNQIQAEENVMPLEKVVEIRNKPNVMQLNKSQSLLALSTQVQTNIINNNQQSATYQLTPKLTKSQDKSRNLRNEYATIRSIPDSTSVNIINQQHQSNHQPIFAASSGYGTSVTESAISVFVCLDNYFYDENFAKIKDRAQETTQVMKANVIQCLLEYQDEFLQTLKTGLESYVRPLSAIMDTDLYLGIFLNIEKIFTLAEFIRNTINQSMLLTQDVYDSYLSVIHEYVSYIN